MGGIREGPVHLEDHRLVHDRVVSGVPGRAGPAVALLRRGPRARRHGGRGLFYSIWWPRRPGDSDVPPPEVVSQVEKRYLRTVWEDMEVWRYMEFVERPPLSKADAEPYFALRQWARQFYDVPA